MNKSKKFIEFLTINESFIKQNTDQINEVIYGSEEEPRELILEIFAGLGLNPDDYSDVMDELPEFITLSWIDYNNEGIYDEELRAAVMGAIDSVRQNKGLNKELVEDIVSAASTYHVGEAKNVNESFIKRTTDQMNEDSIDTPSTYPIADDYHTPHGSHSTGKDFDYDSVVVTDVDTIPNIYDIVNAGGVTYRGLGMGKLADRFFDVAGETGVRILVGNKEYYITHRDYMKLGGISKMKFKGPYRTEDGVNQEFSTSSETPPIVGGL